MSEGKFEKSIWDSLSQDTKEICESIGSVPIGLNTFNEMYDDIAEKSLKELKEKGLIEEMTLEEELKRKTEGFDETQIRQRIVQPKFEGFLPGEKDALNAFDRLKSTNEDQLSSKRLRLTPDFGKFVEKEIQYRDMTENKNLEVEFHSPIDLLRHTASEFKLLDAEAKQSLIVEKNADNVQAKLVERAQLLVDLPMKMSKLIDENKSEFSEESMMQLQQLARIAEERIKEGDYFGLSTLLIHKGSEKGEPNALDKLIEEMDHKKEDQQGNLSNLISPTLKREDFVKMVEDQLVSDEVINIAHKREEAADIIAESLAYIGVFAPKPATFDKEAFKFTGGFDLDPETVDTIWNFLKRTGIFIDESETGPDRVSIEQKTADMLKDASNGFLTYD